ncbi:hypothetical protein CYMTET_10738 [Cymbomonas tetramitiformis]|uniref:Uncharacterized protein n=1 Tax=Cymbomonas tetramitiformis TaxID=36881 RepID=A0AAE0GNM9_9CHLO|nr:hypothetical protein CYMTET_10738 [Cymbomonas tetramitiformis]
MPFGAQSAGNFLPSYVQGAHYGGIGLSGVAATPGVLTPTAARVALSSSAAAAAAGAAVRVERYASAATVAATAAAIGLLATSSGADLSRPTSTTPRSTTGTSAPGY